MYSQYISPFGYQTGTHGIDSYGVNHKDFDIRDEIEYQFARAKRENELMEQYKSLGITDKFPQYGTNFWGNSDNNYGFGISNIASNIANMKNTTTPIPLSSTSQIQNNIQPQIWETAAEGKQVYDNVVRNEGNYQPQYQNIIDYGISVTKAIPNIINNYQNLKNANLSDKYKHAYINCVLSQYGQGGADIAELASNIRETYDRETASNTLDSSIGDQYANTIGRFLGSKYPNGDCNELIQKYIKRKY